MSDMVKSKMYTSLPLEDSGGSVIVSLTARIASSLLVEDDCREVVFDSDEVAGFAVVVVTGEPEVVEARY